MVEIKKRSENIDIYNDNDIGDVENKNTIIPDKLYLNLTKQNTMPTSNYSSTHTITEDVICINDIKNSTGTPGSNSSSEILTNENDESVGENCTEITSAPVYLNLTREKHPKHRIYKNPNDNNENDNFVTTSNFLSKKNFVTTSIDRIKKILQSGNVHIWQNKKLFRYMTIFLFITILIMTIMHHSGFNLKCSINYSNTSLQLNPLGKEIVDILLKNEDLLTPQDNKNGLVNFLKLFDIVLNKLIDINNEKNAELTSPINIQKSTPLNYNSITNNNENNVEESGNGGGGGDDDSYFNFNDMFYNLKNMY